jgi:hypothetical protein
VQLEMVGDRKLTELAPARRNRYYYGKLMDVLHFSMEQQYMLSKQWLYNRAVLGYGVVCGLGVEPLTNASGQGILIRAGLGIDGWGREIVVPNDIPIVPLTITDQCGSPQPVQQLPSSVKVGICFRECMTDYAPAMVNDPGCGCGANCEAGTVVESYCVTVLAGTAPTVTLPCLDDVKKGLAAGDIHAVLCGLSRSCPSEPDDPCLVLANIDVAAGGALTIHDVEPRVIAPTNPMLVQLISCLADCCTSTPTTHPLQVTGVKVLTTGSVDPGNSGGNKPDDPNLKPVPGGTLKPPSGLITVKRPYLPNVIEVTLGTTPVLDQKSVTIGGVPAPQKSVWIKPANDSDKIIPMPGNVFRIYRPTGFLDHNEVHLMGGTANPGPESNTIAATDGTRLDGEKPSAGGTGWHSGDGTQGGDFDLELNVL